MSNTPKRRKKVTLKDVAEAASVSKATASLALSNNPRISEPTRQRVLNAVDKLGYVYNQRAASLRTQRSYTIGLLIKDVTNPFNAELIAGAESQLAAHGYSLLLGTTDDDLDKESRMVKTMLERDVDGLILSPAAGTMSESLRKLMRYCPLVVTTPYFSDLAADCVGMDDENGTQRAVEHLIHQGHRLIAFVGGSEAQSTRQRRIQSYRYTLHQNRIEFDAELCIVSPVSRRGGYDAIRQLLDLPQPPTAAFCYSDVNAFGVMLGLRAAGIEAGKTFAVVGFDNVAEASLWQPSLTTVAIDPTALGENAAQLMLKRIAEPDMPVQRVIMPSQLIVRDSTGILASARTN